MYFQSYGAMSIIKVKAYWFHVRERGVFGAIFGTLISVGVYFAFDWGSTVIVDLTKADSTGGWFQICSRKCCFDVTVGGNGGCDLGGFFHPGRHHDCSGCCSTCGSSRTRRKTPAFRTSTRTTPRPARCTSNFPRSTC